MPKAKAFSAVSNVDSDTFDALHPKLSTHRKQKEKSEEEALESSRPTASSHSELPSLVTTEGGASEDGSAVDRADQPQASPTEERPEQPPQKETKKPFPSKKTAKSTQVSELAEERRLTVRISMPISQKLEMLSEALGIDETGCMRLGLIELWERHVRTGLVSLPPDKKL